MFLRVNASKMEKLNTCRRKLLPNRNSSNLLKENRPNACDLLDKEQAQKLWLNGATGLKKAPITAINLVWLNNIRVSVNLQVLTWLLYRFDQNYV